MNPSLNALLQWSEELLEELDRQPRAIGEANPSVPGALDDAGLVVAEQPSPSAPLIRRLIEALGDGHAAVPCLPSDPVLSDGASTPWLSQSHGFWQLARYARLEQMVDEGIRQRLRQQQDPLWCERLKLALQRVSGHSQEQLLAIAVGLRHRFAIIHGGPGTGKTTTLLGLLTALRVLHGPEHRIALAAPTGKAATRMLEAIAADTSTDGDLANNVEAFTVHRLLGYRPWRDWRFGAAHRLPWDTVLVDEASMLDLELFAQLLQSLPDHARLVLIGDAEQLPPVAVGSVLGPILEAASVPVQPSDQAGHPDTASPRPMESDEASRSLLANAVVRLRQRHRFAAGAGLDDFAESILKGDAEALLAGLHEKRWRGVHWQIPDDALFHAQLVLRMQELRQLGQAPSARQALTMAQRSQWLCALRQGPSGVDVLNRWSEGEREPHAHWYHGRMVMIRSNAPALGLYNGDVGIAWQSAFGSGLRVHFAHSASADHRPGSQRGPGSGLAPGHAIELSYEPEVLPQHDATFAMTVHQAQGSEFERVALWFDDHGEAVLGRQWLYTGVTRAKREVHIYASESALRLSMRQNIVRHSTLAARLSIDR